MVGSGKGSWPFYDEVEVLWRPSHDVPVPKRALAPARITAYVPHPIAGLTITLTDRILQSVIEAETAVAAAQRHSETIGVGTVAQQLLRSEAVASSQMEGVSAPGHRALATAIAADQHRPGARAAIANIDAARWIYDWAAGGDEPFTVDVLCEIHRRLARADSHLAGQAGRLRTQQNWIGTDPYTPVGAAFIPPPASEVRRLLADLCDYANRRDVPALVQAAAIHAQFETVHPFGDGNGRVGRSLIGAVLSRRGVCRDVIPPVSLALARAKDEYVASLTGWRYDETGAQRWVMQLAQATEAAALAADRLASQIGELQATWMDQARRPRRDSSAAAIIKLLPAHPILNAEQAAGLLDRTPVAARSALNALEDAGVLRQISVGRRNRMWECIGLVALLDAMERGLSQGQRGIPASQGAD